MYPAILMDCIRLRICTWNDKHDNIIIPPYSSNTKVLDIMAQL